MINHVVTETIRNFLFDPRTALKNGFIPVYLVTIFSTLTDQVLNQKIEKLLNQGLSSSLVISGLLSTLQALFFPILISAFICFYLVQTMSDAELKIYRFHSLKDFFSSRFELALVEVIRSWGQVFLWSFVFILPGILFYSYYVLVPIVVFISISYKYGERDALKFSTELFKKHWVKISIYYTIFGFIIPVTLTSVADQWTVYNKSPFGFLFFCGLETFVNFIFHALILNLVLPALYESEQDLVFNHKNSFKEIQNGINV